MLYLWTELLPNAALLWLEKYLKVNYRSVEPKPSKANISVGWDSYIAGEPVSVLMQVYPTQSLVTFSIVFLTIDPSKNIDIVSKFLVDFNASFLKGCYIVIDSDKLVFRYSVTMYTFCTKKMVQWISLHWLSILSIVGSSINLVKEVCNGSTQIIPKKDDVYRWN